MRGSVFLVEGRGLRGSEVGLECVSSRVGVGTNGRTLDGRGPVFVPTQTQDTYKVPVRSFFRTLCESFVTTHSVTFSRTGTLRSHGVSRPGNFRLLLLGDSRSPSLWCIENGVVEVSRKCVRQRKYCSSVFSHTRDVGSFMGIQN